MKKLFHNLYFWGFVIGIIVITGIRPFLRHIPDPPPIIGKVPAFSLTNQNGNSFGSEDLKGNVYVANFIFTSCPSICPMLTKSMAKLQEKFQQENINIKLVSFSVDPETDTPEKLKVYAQKFGADPRRWTFLTGHTQNIRDLIENGFKFYLGEKAAQSDGLYEIAHTAKFALVDPEGNLRGLYSSDESGLDEAFRRSQHVLHQKRK